MGLILQWALLVPNVKRLQTAFVPIQCWLQVPSSRARLH